MCDCKKTLDIKFKLDKFGIAPCRGTENSAGFDLYTPNDGQKIPILSGQTKLIPLGIAFEIPENHYLSLSLRSGFSTKEGQGLIMVNSPGIIDSDFRGFIKCPVINTSDHTIYIEPATRICQGIILEYPKLNFIQVDELTVTERNTGGFGSTGQK